MNYPAWLTKSPPKTADHRLPPEFQPCRKRRTVDIAWPVMMCCITRKVLTPRRAGFRRLRIFVGRFPEESREDAASTSPAGAGARKSLQRLAAHQGGQFFCMDGNDSSDGATREPGGGKGRLFPALLHRLRARRFQAAPSSGGEKRRGVHGEGGGGACQPSAWRVPLEWLQCSENCPSPITLILHRLLQTGH